MRMVTLALRGVLAVVVTVALALSTGLAAAQNLTEATQESDNEAQTTAETQTTANTSSSDTWSEGDAKAFTELSGKTITNIPEKIVYLMVDSQFVTKSNGAWTEGQGADSNGTPPTDAYKGTYTGSTQIVPDGQDTVASDGFLSNTLADPTKLHYYWNELSAGNASGLWGDISTNLNGYSFDGLYVYYKNQLRTRLAWAGKIDGDTWVVPWDDSKSRDAQCNPSNKTNDANKCFMTKLSTDDGAYLAMSFGSQGSTTINYGTATSAGNAIGLASELGTGYETKAENAEGTILSRTHPDNQPTILGRDERIRQGGDFSFNVQLSHGGTYLRVFYAESDTDENVSACPATADVTNKSNATATAFLGTDVSNSNLVYAPKLLGSGINGVNKGVEVADTSDELVKTVTINASVMSGKKHAGVCVQEVYWYLQGYKNAEEQTQTVKLSSTFAMLNSDEISAGYVRGGMYIKTFTDYRTSSGKVGTVDYYAADSTGPNASTDFTFNSCSSTVRNSYAHWKNAYGRGYCDDDYLWVTGTTVNSTKSGYQNGIPRDGYLNDQNGVYENHDYNADAKKVNPGPTFFEQLRRGTSNYGDNFSSSDLSNYKGTDTASTKELVGTARAVIGAASSGKDSNTVAGVAMSNIHDEDAAKTYSKDVSYWAKNENRTASVKKTINRGDTVSFLVMNTSRVSNGLEYYTGSVWGYTQLLSNLTICTAATTATTTNCENVSVGDLESIASPNANSRNNNLAWSAFLDSDGGNQQRRDQGQEEAREYRTSNRSTTMTLIKGALKGTRVTLSWLPNFFRDGNIGFGGFWSSDDDVRAIHPLLVTVENLTTNIDMQLNWLKNKQTFVNMGDVRGIEKLEIAQAYYNSSNNTYYHDRFKWTEISSGMIGSQWYDYTDQLAEDNAMVVRFKIKNGYRIDEFRYGSRDTAQASWESEELSKAEASTAKFQSNLVTSKGTYNNETYYTYSGTKLSGTNPCLQGDTDGYYYCRIKVAERDTSDSKKIKTSLFSFVASPVTYTVKYEANDKDVADPLTVGDAAGEVSRNSIETNTKYYAALELSSGLKVTTSRPTINNNLSSSSPKFFLYWKVYIKYRVYTKDAETYESKLADGTTYYYKLKAVQANTGDSVDDREKGDNTTLVVYPGQVVDVKNYYSQMPLDTLGVELRAKWTTVKDYEAVNRQVTAYVQTFDSSGSSSSLWYNWSATDGSGAVAVRQESYVVLIPQSNASSSTSYASTYPAYEDTTNQDGKGFLPKSATLNYVSNGTGGWTQQANTAYTLVSDKACSATATAATAGAGATEYCTRNDIKKNMGAKKADPSVAVPVTASRSNAGDGQMMVGYYRVELSDEQKVSYKTNVCAKDDTAKTDCAYDYDAADDFTANVDSSWLFRGHYLFDNTRPPMAGVPAEDASGKATYMKDELPWTRLEANSKISYRWFFTYWSLDTAGSTDGKQEPTTSTAYTMPGTYIGRTANTSKSVLGLGTVYYAQWKSNSSPTFSIRTETSNGDDLENGAVFQLYMWDEQVAGRTPTEADVIERNADGTGKVNTTGSYWRPVIQYEPTGTDAASLANYVTIPTVAEVQADTAGSLRATQVTTSDVSNHSGVAQWRGLTNGYSATGADLSISDYANTGDADKEAAAKAATDGKITLPIATTRGDMKRSAKFKGATFALIQVKAPSKKYVCNTGQWMFKISDYVSEMMSTISSPEFAGSLGTDRNSVYSYGRVGGTNITPAGTVHAIIPSVPLAGVGEYANVSLHKRGAAVVNIDAFDLPAAGWRVPLLLMFAGLALTLSSWAAYGLNNRRRAMAYATARGSSGSGGRRGGSGRRRRGRAAVRRVHAHIKARLRHGRRA